MGEVKMCAEEECLDGGGGVRRWDGEDERRNGWDCARE